MINSWSIFYVWKMETKRAIKTTDIREEGRKEGRREGRMGKCRITSDRFKSETPLSVHLHINREQHWLMLLKSIKETLKEPLAACVYRRCSRLDGGRTTQLPLRQELIPPGVPLHVSERSPLFHRGHTARLFVFNNRIKQMAWDRRRYGKEILVNLKIKQPAQYPDVSLIRLTELILLQLNMQKEGGAIHRRGWKGDWS